MWWGLYNHFHVQPNFSVEVLLHCVFVGVAGLTKKSEFVVEFLSSQKYLKNGLVIKMYLLFKHFRMEQDVFRQVLITNLG